MMKEKQEPKKTEEMKMSKSEFDALMRHALGVPPEPKAKPKKKTPKKGKA